jgi:hypothetical protein
VLVLALGPVDPRLPGAQLRTDLASLDVVLARVPRERLIVAHCDCAADSAGAEAALRLRRKGFERAFFLDRSRET